MNILETLVQLRDDLKTWVTNNLNALNAKIDEKTIPIDKELSSTSTNPVQNKAIKKAIDNIPKFSGSYNDLTDAPNITEDDSGNMVIADESGNIIFKADVDGIHTTAVSLNGEAAASEKYVDEAIANIDIPEVDFTGYATEEYVTVAIDTTKAELSESIVAESQEWKVTDGDGNIIFSVDAEGAHTTALTLNGESVEDMIDVRVASLVDSAPDTLNTLNELAQALGDDPNFATTVTTEISKKVDKVAGKDLSTNDFTDEYKSQLDNFEETDPTVPAWAKEPTKPTYTAAEVGLGNVNNTSDADKPVSNATQAALDALKAEVSESIVSTKDEWKVTDNSGNIIVKVDSNGLETTVVTAQSVVVDGIDVKTSIDNKADILHIHNQYLEADDISGLAKTTYVDEQLATKSDVGHSHEEYLTADDIANKADRSELHSHNNKAELDKIVEGKVAYWDSKSDFSGAYADLIDAPNIAENNSGDLVIADKDGNVIFRSNGAGFETTTLTAKYVVVNGNDITSTIDNLINTISGKVDSSDLNNYYTKEQTNSIELITTEEIDAICSATTNVNIATLSEGVF